MKYIEVVTSARSSRMEKQKAKKSMVIYVLGWLAMPALLIWFIYLRNSVTK
jgi:hypothetical protein